MILIRENHVLGSDPILTMIDEPRRRRQQQPVVTPLLEVEQGDNLNNSNTTKTVVKRKKKRRRGEELDIPFSRLVLHVGITLLLLLIVFVGTYRLVYPYHPPLAQDNGGGDDDGDGYVEVSPNEAEKQQQQQVDANPTRAPSPRTASPFPQFQLSGRARFDPYGLVKTYYDTTKASTKAAATATTFEEFWNRARALRNEFSDRYGGENSARAILERALSTFGSIGGKKDDDNNNNNNNNIMISSFLPTDLQATACRLDDCQGDFKIAFGGYSVTAGRGNYFHQSFPFVMQQHLEPLLDAIGIELEVRNAAIGGIPSFPYGWCLENFWGLDPDVVSWDYSMNEAGGVVQGLEAYLRQTQSLLHKQPKLIVKDTHMAVDRRNLLQQYVDRNTSLVDPVVMHGDPAIEPFMEIEDRFRPLGFQDWRKFGAPPGSPGQAAHHPSKREHELYGWILTMHFLGALEVLVLSREGKVALDCSSEESLRTIPPQPVSTNDTTSIMFGINHKVHCRTSLEPIVSGDMTEIIASGVVDTSAEDLLMPRGAMYYHKGWVLDLSDAERLAKRKLDRYGGLGFVDSKKAYYGIYNSGPITFHLPVKGAADGDKVQLETIVLCQVNERQRDRDACQPDKHISFWIGGENVTRATMMDAPGTLYLGHKLCINLSIPDEAVFTTFQGQAGVNVTARIHDVHIIKKELACSISHVVWEEKVK